MVMKVIVVRKSPVERHAGSSPASGTKNLLVGQRQYSTNVEFFKGHKWVEGPHQQKVNMLTIYLVIAVFAGAFATAGGSFSDNPFFGAIWGLLWPLMIVMMIFFLVVSRR